MQRSADFDMKPPGALAASLQEAGIPLATTVSYKNQLAFPGRLREPLEMVERSQLRGWLEQHPEGVIVTFKEPLPDALGLEVIGRFPYRRGEILFRRLEQPAADADAG
jgi:hypothetical protein